MIASVHHIIQERLWQSVETVLAEGGSRTTCVLTPTRRLCAVYDSFDKGDGESNFVSLLPPLATDTIT